MNIIGHVPNRGQRIGKLIGQGLETAGNIAGDYMKIQAENEALKRKYGVDLSGIRDPQTRQQILADEIKYGRLRKQAEASKNVNYIPENLQGVEEESLEKEQRKPSAIGSQGPLPPLGFDSFAAGERRPERKPGEEYPYEVGKGEHGLIRPKIKRRAPLPEMDPLQEDEFARKIQEENNSNPNNLPMSLLDAKRVAREQSEYIKIYNADVQAENNAREAEQEGYGTLAAENLLQVLPDASLEQIGAFNVLGSELAEKYKNPAVLKAKLAQEATDFKNRISSIPASVPRDRLLGGLKNLFLGTERKRDDIKDDILVKVQPLLNMGLYDTVRLGLAKAKWHPEEVEWMISDLGEPTRKILSKINKVDDNYVQQIAALTRNPLYVQKESKKQNYDMFEKGVNEILQSDPSVNLVLLRKDLMDKGMDWNTYKNIINKSIKNGTFKPNRDQEKFLTYLEYPPYDALEAIMHEAKIY